MQKSLTYTSVKAILFDIDGVLVQTYFDGCKTFPNSLYFAKNYGITSQQTQEFYQKHFEPCVLGKTDVKDVLKEFLPKWNWPKSVDEYMSEWIAADSHFYSQNLALAKELKSRGYQIFIATNQEKYRTESLKKQFAGIFDGIFSSCELVYLKSNPEFWQRVQKRLNLQPSEILLIDDSLENIETAANLGFRTILFDESQDNLGEILREFFD